MEPHELSDILVSFMKQCINKQRNSSSDKPSSDQLQDASHLFSDWIVENKLDLATREVNATIAVLFHK